MHAFRELEVRVIQELDSMIPVLLTVGPLQFLEMKSHLLFVSFNFRLLSWTLVQEEV